MVQLEKLVKPGTEGNDSKQSYEKNMWEASIVRGITDECPTTECQTFSNELYSGGCHSTLRIMNASAVFCCYFIILRVTVLMPCLIAEFYPFLASCVPCRSDHVVSYHILKLIEVDKNFFMKFSNLITRN